MQTKYSCINEIGTISKPGQAAKMECLLSGIHEVGATEGRNKSPPCEVSDRLLATLEKVQNNIGGNTGQRRALRLWNTWINAIIGLNMDDMWRQPATKRP